MVKHTRTSSVPVNLAQAGSSSSGGGVGLTHSRSKSWISQLLNNKQSTQQQQPPTSPSKRHDRSQAIGSVSKKNGLHVLHESADLLGHAIEDGLPSPTAAAPLRPARPTTAPDQDILTLRYSPSKPARQPRAPITSSSSSSQPRMSWALNAPPPEGVPSLRAMRANLPPIRPRSQRRSEGFDLAREWKELLADTEEAEARGAGRALGDATNAGERRRVARREVPVVLNCPPTPIAEEEANSIRSASSASYHDERDILASLQLELGLDRVEKADKLAPRPAPSHSLSHESSFLSLSAFPSPPLAGAEAFISTTHSFSSLSSTTSPTASPNRSLAERRAKLIERLVLRPPSAFDDETPSPSPASAMSPESQYDDEHENDNGNQIAEAGDLSRELAKLMSMAHEVEQGTKLSLTPATAVASRFSPITNSSDSAGNSSFDDDDDSSCRSPVSVKMERSPVLTGAGLHAAIGSALLGLSTASTIPGELILDGLAIDGLSAAQRCSASQWAAQLHQTGAPLPASPAESLADPMGALAVPASSTFTAASFSPFAGSVASFSTDPSSVDDEQTVVVPENVKWRWERSGVFPSSSAGSVGSRVPSGASSFVSEGASEKRLSFHRPSPRPSLAPSISNEHGSVLGYYIRDAGRSPSSIWDKSMSNSSSTDSPDQSVVEHDEWSWSAERRKSAVVGDVPELRLEREYGEVVEWGVAL